MAEENIIYDYGSEKPKRSESQPESSNVCGCDDDYVIVGFVLIGLGLYFLLGALNIKIAIVWWQWLILLPGIGMLAQAFIRWMRFGWLDKETREHAFGGVMVVFVAVIFIFGLDWGKVWPLFLIIPGVAMLIGWIDD